MEKLIILIAAFILVSCSLHSIKTNKQVKTPRDGKAINSKLTVVYSSKYLIKFGGLEKLHPFDIRKYKKIYKKLVSEKLLNQSDVFVPEIISEDDILRVQSRSFLQSLKKSRDVAVYLEAYFMRFFPSFVLRKSIINPFKYATGGTLLSSRLALKYGVSINISGGYHHAMPDRGEGFCLFADIPIAIKKLQAENKINRALIIDLDIHQGNGTAVCLQDDETTFTFSMHQGNIYPIPKEKSDLDIELESGMNDAEYFKILQENLPELIKVSNPDIVYIVGGCDTLKGDPLASLNMTEQGIVQRDWLVIEECLRQNIPVVMTLAGGYSKNAWHVQYSSIKNIIEQIKNI
ncbi:MAG: histone deacetylase [Candidatus Cloacimonetes bacterium]|nr:histone deacetylase [Candidatus Cloacimonadota bacterium]